MTLTQISLSIDRCISNEKLLAFDSDRCTFIHFAATMHSHTYFMKKFNEQIFLRSNNNVCVSIEGLTLKYFNLDNPIVQYLIIKLNETD